MGPEAPAQQCYPEIAQAILPALTAAFGSLEDPIKAWKDWKERRGETCAFVAAFPLAGHSSRGKQRRVQMQHPAML